MSAEPARGPGRVRSGSGAVRLAATCLLLCTVVARAQERPDEDALFGGTPDGGTPRASGAAEEPRAGAPDAGVEAPAAERGLDATPSSDAFAAGRVQEDPLKIGGQFYTRAVLQVSQDQPFDRSRVSLPTLVDAYLDARPTERLRAFVLGRLTYDPFQSTTVGGTAFGGTTTSTSASNPGVLLDQAWLAFDIQHTVFVTAGRQHVKWGVARFFSPTDFLASQPRDPLAVFDARLGVTMLRAVVPWEKTGWNFTAVALFEPTQNVGGGYSGSGAAVQNAGGSGIDPTGTTGTQLRDVGGAVRAEFAFKKGSFGIDGLAQRNRKARAGADVTMALGDFDVYGEVAVKNGLDVPAQRTLSLTSDVDVGPLTGGRATGTVPVTNTATVTLPGVSSPVVQAAGGGSYSWNLEGNKSLTAGVEYFYNSASYDRRDYVRLLVGGGFQPFYVGRHYVAGNLVLIDPTAKTTWSLTGLGNLTDGSYLARLDFIVTVLSYLSVETYVSGHAGRTGGEFRLGFPATKLGALTGGASTTDSPSIGPVNAPVFDAGIGLRLGI